MYIDKKEFNHRGKNIVASRLLKANQAKNIKKYL